MITKITRRESELKDASDDTIYKGNSNKDFIRIERN